MQPRMGNAFLVESWCSLESETRVEWAILIFVALEAIPARRDFQADTSRCQRPLALVYVATQRWCKAVPFGIGCDIFQTPHFSNSRRVRPTVNPTGYPGVP